MLGFSVYCKSLGVCIILITNAHQCNGCISTYSATYIFSFCNAFSSQAHLFLVVYMFLFYFIFYQMLMFSSVDQILSTVLHSCETEACHMHN